jgi:hypothetical protein
MLKFSSLLKQSDNQFQKFELFKKLKCHCNKMGYTEIKANQVLSWSMRLIQFHNQQHPSDLSQSDIETFITWLAYECHYTKNTQQEAVNALQLMYANFLNINLGHLSYQSLKTRKPLESRFGFSACRSVLDHMHGTSLLMAELAFYGKFTLREIVRIKISDVNLKKNRIIIRSEDNSVRNVVAIPLKLNLSIRIQMMRVRQLINQRLEEHDSNLTKQIQIASIEKHGRISLRNDEFLFPSSNSKSNLATSQSLQLLLLKNDLKIAIKQFQLTSRNNVEINSPIKSKRKQITYYSNRTGTGFYSTNLEIKQANFKFKQQGQSNVINRGAA